MQGKLKYAYLRNERGEIFDEGFFTSLRAARNWARRRGGRYTLTVELAEGVVIESRTYGRRRGNDRLQRAECGVVEE